MRPLPSQARLRYLFTYDPTSGVFVWNISRSYKTPVGAIAGSVRKDGYCVIKISGDAWLANRLAWVYMTGCSPANEVDHINGVKSDNRWENLRDAAHNENCRNRKEQPNTVSGLKGVSVAFNKRREPIGWRARIAVDGKTVELGTFATTIDAAQAYDGAAVIYHGEFARLNFALDGKCLSP